MRESKGSQSHNHRGRLQTLHFRSAKEIRKMADNNASDSEGANELNPNNVTKYQTAADIANRE